MDLVALFVTVQISDHPERSERILVGVYNNVSQLIQDKAMADRKYSSRLRAFQELNLIVNKSLILE